METARGGEASSSGAANVAGGGGMKRSPTWLEVSNLKLDAGIKRRDDYETAIEWDYLTSPSLECGLTHLDLEHLREVAVRRGCGDDEIRRFAWPLVLGIGLEPGERGDPDEYVDRAAFAEAGVEKAARRRRERWVERKAPAIKSANMFRWQALITGKVGR